MFLIFSLYFIVFCCWHFRFEHPEIAIDDASFKNAVSLMDFFLDIDSKGTQQHAEPILGFDIKLTRS